MNYIINPKDNKKYSVFSDIGKNILKNYINTFMTTQKGGMIQAFKKKRKKKKKKNNCELIINPVSDLDLFNERIKKARSLTKIEKNKYVLKEDELCETLKSLHSYRPYMYACAVTNDNNEAMMIIPDLTTIQNNFKMIINPLTKEFNGVFGTDEHDLSFPNPENHSNVWGVKSLVLCAGWIVLNEDKKIIYIDRNSGHFKPEPRHLKCVVELLKKKYPNCVVNPHNNLFVNDNIMITAISYIESQKGSLLSEQIKELKLT